MYLAFAAANPGTPQTSACGAACLLGGHEAHGHLCFPCTCGSCAGGCLHIWKVRCSSKLLWELTSNSIELFNSGGVEGNALPGSMRAMHLISIHHEGKAPIMRVSPSYFYIYIYIYVCAHLFTSLCSGGTASWRRWRRGALDLSAGSTGEWVSEILYGIPQTLGVTLKDKSPKNE